MDLVQHLKDRGMNPDLYSVWYDHENSLVYFLLYNLSGQIVGYQKYNPTTETKKIKNDPQLGRYYTYLPKMTNGVFGLECLDNTKPQLFVTEGVFKAAVLHRLGFNAIAVLTSTPKPLKRWVHIMKKQYNVIAIGDNDDAGKKLVNSIGAGFQSPKDLDEMTDKEILHLLMCRYVI